MFIAFSLFVMFPRISGVYPYDEQAVHGPTARQQINRFEPTDRSPLLDQHGHTPGSVGVLAHTQRGWILIAGDAAWHQLQIENARQKSGYPGVLVDEDRDETFKTLQRLHLARHAVTVIPTHDHQAAPRLSASRPDTPDRAAP
jgi:hypothetical protein